MMVAEKRKFIFMGLSLCFQKDLCCSTLHAASLCPSAWYTPARTALLRPEQQQGFLWLTGAKKGFLDIV